MVSQVVLVGAGRGEVKSWGVDQIQIYRQEIDGDYKRSPSLGRSDSLRTLRKDERPLFSYGMMGMPSLVK